MTLDPLAPARFAVIPNYGLLDTRKFCMIYAADEAAAEVSLEKRREKDNQRLRFPIKTDYGTFCRGACNLNSTRRRKLTGARRLSGVPR